MGRPRLEELPHYLYEDYVCWEGRWELINGVPYAMVPAPSRKHQSLSSRVDRLLQEALEDCKRCEVLLPVDWKIADDTIVQPDNLVICDDTDETPYISRAPRLIFEILSKGTAHKDRGLKLKLYEREGVSYYVIVDPEAEASRVFQLQHGSYVDKGDLAQESFDFDLGACRFTLDFSRVWS